MTRRTGHTLIRVLSAQRHPEHLKFEAMVVGKAEVEALALWFGTWMHKDITVSTSPDGRPAYL